MKLTRKSGAPTLKNKQNLDIPNATVMSMKFTMDYQLKKMHIKYGMYSDDAAINNEYEPIETGEFYFDENIYLPEWTSGDGVVYTYDNTNYRYKEGMDDTNKPDSITGSIPDPGTIVTLTAAEIADLTETYIGQYSYDLVLPTLAIEDDEVKPITQGSKDWIMAQPDWDGLPFSTNWELLED